MNLSNQINFLKSIMSFLKTGIEEQFRAATVPALAAALTDFLDDSCEYSYINSRESVDYDSCTRLCHRFERVMNDVLRAGVEAFSDQFYSLSAVFMAREFHISKMDKETELAFIISGLSVVDGKTISRDALAYAIRDYAVRYFDASYRLGDISIPSFGYGEEIGDKIQCDNGERLHNNITECVDRIINHYDIPCGTYAFSTRLALMLKRHIIIDNFGG